MCQFSFSSKQHDSKVGLVLVWFALSIERVFGSWSRKYSGFPWER